MLRRCCLTRLARANPELANFIDALANDLPCQGTVHFEGKRLDRAALRALAAKYVPNNARRYVQVARAMETKDATVEMPDGRVMTQRDLYVEAIRLEPTEPDHYDALRKDLGPDETVEMADGRVVGDRDLLLAEIAHTHRPWYKAYGDRRRAYT